MTTTDTLLRPSLEVRRIPLYLPLDGKPKMDGLEVVMGAAQRPNFKEHLRRTWRARDELGAITATGIFANVVVQLLGNGTPVFNLLSVHQRCAMFTNSITPAFDDTVVHCGYNQAGGQYAANEVTGDGYSAGGAGDSSVSGTFGGTPTVTNTSGVVEYTTSNAIWAASTISSAAGALIYDNALTNKTGWMFVSFGGSYNTNNGTFTIQWSPQGIFYWTVHS